MEGLIAFLSGLKKGMSTVTSTALIVCLLTSCTILIFMLATTPAQFVSLLKYYPEVENSKEYLYAYIRAVESNPEVKGDERPAVFIIGASTLRESVVSEDYIATSLSDHGISAQIIDLTSSAQPFWYGKLLLEAATCRPKSIVVMAANLARLRAHPNLARRDDYPIPPIQSGWTYNTFKIRSSFIIRAVLRGLLIPDLRNSIRRGKLKRLDYGHQPGRHRYIHKSKNSNKREELLRRFKGIIEQKRRWYTEEFAEEVINLRSELNKCTDAKIILVDTPQNPAIKKRHNKLYERLSEHRNEIKELASRINGGFIAFEERINYKESDFHDHSHLRSWEAIIKTTDALVDEIVRNWNLDT